MNNRLVLLAVLLLVGSAVGALGVAGQSTGDFALESGSTVAVPTETVSNSLTDGELTIRETAVVEPGETLTGTATVPNPSEQTYFIQFRDSDQRVIDDTSTDGAETSYRFKTDQESPGSYAVNIWDPNEQLVTAVLPVVIASHDVSSVSVDGSSPADADVAASETASVDVSLTTLESTSIDSVNVTVWNDGYRESATLERTDDGEYAGTLPALDEDEYQVQVRVRGGETVNGRPSLIGLSEAYGLTVEPADTSDGSTSDGDTDSGSTDQPGGGSDTTDGDDDTSGEEDTTQETDDTDETTNGTSENGTDTESGTGDSTSDDTSDDTSEPTDSTSDSNGSADSTDDTDGAIAPNDNSTSPDETADSTPLYAIHGILLTIMFGGILRRLRRQR